MRECLRDVDLIGQLTDTLFVAILPQTKLGEAEELSQRILSGLGPQPSLTLTTIEVTESSQIAQILARGKIPSAQR